MDNKYDVLYLWCNKKKGGKRMDVYQSFVGTLGRLLNEILLMEQKVVLSGKFKDLTNNDIRVIDSIGTEQPRNMTSIAKEIGVTVGTLTIAMNSLVKKGYVLRARSTEDRRLVLVSLSAKGVDAYKANVRFRSDMIQAAIQGFDEEQCKVLEQALSNLSEFFKEYK